MGAFKDWLFYAEPLETRSLEQVTDIGLAFERAQNDLLGYTNESVASVFRARQFIADTVASLPMEQFTGRVRDNNQPPILLDPNPDISYHEFWSQVVLSLLDEGNAGIWVSSRDSNGNPTRLHVIPWQEITVNWKDDAHLYRNYRWFNKTVTPNRDFIHIAINRRAGDLTGKGPIQAAASSLLPAAQAEEVIAKSMVEEEFGPRWHLTHPDARTKQDSDRIRDQVESDRGSRRKKMMITDPNTVINQIPVNLAESQWIEGRQFTVQQIGRLFGLNGQFLLVESGSSLTYSTTETLFRQFLTQTLRPSYLERIEHSVSRLLPVGKKAHFNSDEILRADIVSRYQAYQIGSGGAGFLTVNEVRAAEGLSAIPGGDEMIAVSVQPKDQAANQPKEVPVNV